jgi:hypothetical protein
MACADPAATAPRGLPAHGPCRGDLFLIGTEKARTTGNTKARTLLAESLTQQVVARAIDVPRDTGPGLLEAVYEQCPKIPTP